MDVEDEDVGSGDGRFFAGRDYVFEELRFTDEELYVCCLDSVCQFVRGVGWVCPSKDPPFGVLGVVSIFSYSRNHTSSHDAQECHGIENLRLYQICFSNIKDISMMFSLKFPSSSTEIVQKIAAEERKQSHIIESMHANNISFLQSRFAKASSKSSDNSLCLSI